MVKNVNVCVLISFSNELENFIESIKRGKIKKIVVAIIIAKLLLGQALKKKTITWTKREEIRTRNFHLCPSKSFETLESKTLFMNAKVKTLHRTTCMIVSYPIIYNDFDRQGISKEFNLDFANTKASMSYLNLSNSKITDLSPVYLT